MEQQERRKLSGLERRLDYRFKDKHLLKCALTHKSYANENGLSANEYNERYEFLGDAVLELAISNILMDVYPNKPEGDLSKLRAAAVNEEQLAEVARNIDLGKYLYLGKGEELTGGRNKDSVLSDALEALFGAVYLDSNFDVAKQLINGLFDNIIKIIGSDGFIKDYKTRLQEEVQALYKTVPHYRLAGESGPDHRKTFEVELYIDGKLCSTGKGTSKKSAEQNAAKIALERLLNKAL